MKAVKVKAGASCAPAQGKAYGGMMTKKGMMYGGMKKKMGHGGMAKKKK
jgi:hypothetical protein